MNKIIPIMTSALFIPTILAGEQTRKLVEPVNLPIVIEGKTVGSMKLSAGEQLDVLSDNGTNAVINRGGTDYTIPSHSLEAAAALSPTPTPPSAPILQPSLTPSPSPTPFPTVTPSPLNAGRGSSTGSSAGSLNLLPPIPEPGSNPHFKNMFDGVHLGEAKYGVNPQAEQEETLLAALAYLHPQSHFKGNQAALDRLLLLLNGRFSLWAENKELGDFMGAFQSTYAYLALKTYAPDKIPSDKKSIWEDAIKKHTASLINGAPKLYKDHIAGATIANMDILRTQSVYFGALATGDKESAEIGRSAMENDLPKVLLSDGATHYDSYSNETYLYHFIIVRNAGWYYLFTGSPSIKQLLLGMSHYSPLTQDRGGYAEYSTAPAWKPFYTSNVGKDMALLEAYLTGDPYNFTIGKEATSEPILAFYYHPGISGAELPDNFMLYDRNVLGPRGRFGTWGVVGTTRDPSKPGPELQETSDPEGCGINTFAGAYILDEKTRKLSGALHGTAPEVKIAKGEEKDWNRGGMWAYLTGADCHNAVSKGNLVYGLSTRYPIQNRKGFGPEAYTGWDGIQSWVYTPDRIIGLTGICSQKSETAYGLAQRLVLFSYRGTCKPGDGKAQEVKSDGEDSWSYGNLRLKAYAKEYLGKVETFYFGLMANYGGADHKDDAGSAMIVLHDEKSGNDTPTLFPAGTQRSVILEVTHDGKKFSTDLMRLKLPDGLNGFEFTEEAGRKIRMIHNTTEKPIDYSDVMKSPYGKARIIMSWEDNALNPLVVSGGSVAIPRTTIPAYGNIVVVSSNVADDHVPGFKDYNKVFTASQATGGH
jgi:hypothetical protein